MIGRAHSAYRSAGHLCVRLPHALTANRPLRPDAAHLGGAAAKALAAQKKLSSLAAQLGQQRSSAVGEAAVPVFPLGTAAPTIAHTHASVLDSDREAPMLQAIRQLVANGEMNAFNMYDLEIVRDQLHRFRRNLPRVQPFYAMKCNPDARVVALLAAEGCNFDCASKAEIQIALDNGATADRIIFANPCKQPSHVAFAHSVGVNVSTFDGADELYKIAALQPGADLVFRVQVDDSHAVCTMSQKYGAPLAHLPELLTVAQSLGLNVIGVSYHVGSGSQSAQPFADAVKMARAAFDLAAQHGVTFRLLDIGGGFPGTIEQLPRGDEPLLELAAASTHKAPAFEEIAAVLRPALDEHFPAGCGVHIIAEPGRYMVQSCATLVTNIIGRKFANKGLPTERPMYFVNDGLYGSFNCVLYDHKNPVALPLFNTVDAGSREQDVANYSDASIWGSTCDGMDCIAKEAKLPLLSVGDWIRWPGMGAYTSAAGSNFNGMDRPTNYYL